MLALFRNVMTGEPQAVSRIFLDQDGRKIGRQFTGPVSGAAVMLDPFEDVLEGLYIGEGVETVMAARQMGLRPGWALGSKNGIAAFPVLSGVNSLTLLEENDGGKSAAACEACALRWHGAGREVIINRSTIGKDLNDAISGRAMNNNNASPQPPPRFTSTKFTPPPEGSTRASKASAAPGGRSSTSSGAGASKDDGRREHLLLASWLKRNIPPRDYLLGSVFCTTSRWLIFGETGIGKTLLAADIAGAMAAGRPFLDWGGRRQARVMYLDGEMPAETFKERMQLIAERYGEDIPLFGYNRDDLGDGAMPPLNEEDGEKWLMKETDLIRPDAIIFDSIMCLLSGVMSDEESWTPTKHLVRRITSKQDRPNLAAPHRPRRLQGLRHQDPRMGNGHGRAAGLRRRQPRSYRAGVPEGAAPHAAEFRTVQGAHAFARPDGWSFDAMSGKPMDGRRSAEVIKLKRAIVDAYSRLSDGAPTDDWFRRSDKSGKSKPRSCGRRSGDADSST